MLHIILITWILAGTKKNEKKKEEEEEEIPEHFGQNYHPISFGNFSPINQKYQFDNKYKYKHFNFH